MPYSNLPVVGTITLDGSPVTTTITLTPPSDLRDSLNTALSAITVTVTSGVVSGNAKRLDDPGTTTHLSRRYTVSCANSTVAPFLPQYINAHQGEVLDLSVAAKQDSYARTSDVASGGGGGGAVASVNTRTGAVTGLAEDSAVVHNTGAETVAGVKTFSSAPVVPSAAFPESAVSGLVSDLAAKAADSAVVHNTGTETIAGAKTFSTAPVVPTASFPESAVTNLVTDLAAKAADSAVVHNTGAETIAGVKTFSSSPVVPNGSFAEAAVTNLVTDLAAKAVKLVPTAVKTSAYTAAVGDFVPVDTTAGSVTITLPTAPADGSVIGIKHVVRGSTNTVSLALGGSDKFNVAGGSTTGTLTLLNQGTTLLYKSSTALWYSISTDVPLSQLDTRYLPGGVALQAATPPLLLCANAAALPAGTPANVVVVLKA